MTTSITTLGQWEKGIGIKNEMKETMKLTYEIRQKINRGRQLNFAREYRGMSQTELSKAVQGLSQSNLSKYEKGFGGISEKTLQKTMEVLDFPTSFLDKKVQVHFVTPIIINSFSN